jgi:mono/diheme cytochrome c family protein
MAELCLGKSGRREAQGSRPGREPRVRLRASAVGLVALAAIALGGCRVDMHVQPRYQPYQATDFFADGRSERPMVPGTVPHGMLRTDELRYRGTINGAVANEFPFPITAADLERGRERFNIYCTPCHDYTGSGHGVVPQRGFQQPPSYHSERLREAPVGHFFQVITNGYGAMYSYADRVSPDDRWRIAAYIRALQLSQHAPLADVPAAELQKLQQGK